MRRRCVRPQVIAFAGNWGWTPLPVMQNQRHAEGLIPLCYRVVSPPFRVSLALSVVPGRG